MLLEYDDVMPASRQDARGGESRGSGADDRDVTHSYGSVLAPARFPCAQHANPK